ncbi:DUF1349 domain-containing protein [Pelagicoccus sp. NFK12]|uniref:DUF1349 domain-containing protein n=1 Tax=Pelagicoccus enzymogenes TaxID=2773457 RepID=A0A927IIF1_9BACT|nr:DUF1349 domain-containing protein [Pelagicoccus enzymogenes]MBD5781201.1 DUF1349 domain-containing protein [Pelagicoccus enzymogenes]
MLPSADETAGYEYVWRSDIDGVLGDFIDEWHTSDLSVGYHTISLIAYQNGETVATARINLSILSNIEPYVSVSISEGNGQYVLGDLVSFEAEAIDSEDGDVTDRIQWSSNLDGPLEGKGRYLSLDSLSAGLHRVRASSTDSRGAVGYGEVEVFVETPRRTFVSEDFSREKLDLDLWKFRDPVGDAGYALEGGVLKMTVPPGRDHDIWVGGNRAPRVSQRILNTPFGLQAKFASTPTERFQSQGLFVEQDSRNFIRYDFYSNGTGLFVFCASFTNGKPKTLFNSKISPSDQYYLRIDRSESKLVFYYSFDGQRWTEAGALDRNMDVVEVGVYAGNASAARSDAPGFTAVVDYVFNVESPIFPEDSGGPDSLPHVVASRIGNSGPVVIGHSLRLSGSAVDVEEGLLDDELVWMSSLDGELSVTGPTVEIMGLSEGTHEIYALCRGVESERLSVEVGPDRAPQVVIEERQGLGAEGKVEGRYLQAFVTDDVDEGLGADVIWESSLAGFFSAKGGVLDLRGMSPGLHHIQASVKDSVGNWGSGKAKVLILSESEKFVSDRFKEASFDEKVWMQIDPLGDSHFACEDGALSIFVPSGSSHDVWENGNLAPRLMQRVRDEDFSLQVKFDALPSKQFQSQGIILEEDADNFIRYDYYSNGRDLYVFCAVFVDGDPKVVFNETARGSDSLHLKVVRAGSSYRFHSSPDGEDWLLNGTLENDMDLEMAGVFAGNAKDAASPAFIAKVDHVLYEASDANDLLAATAEEEDESVVNSGRRSAPF